MIALAEERASKQGVQLDLCIADINAPLPVGDAEFDLVFTATALHYVEDLQAVIGEVARVLKPGGRFIASVLHPMSTARFPVAHTDAADRSWESRREWRESYFDHSKRIIETPWLGFGNVSDGGMKISCYHHTTGDYFAAIRAAGLMVSDLCEPAPPEEFARKSPARYEEAMAMPVYLMLKANKR